MTCSNCGEENAAGAAFCGNCGSPLAAGPPSDEPPATPGQPPLPPIPPPPPPSTADPTLVSGVPPVPPVPPADPTMAFGTPPPGPPEMAPVQKKSKKSLLIALLALLVVAALVGSFLLLSGDDDGGGDEIVLEPIGLSVEDDFAGDLDLAGFDSSIANVLPDVPPLGSGIAAALSGLQAEGDTPGLYGGTRDVATCDVDQLVEFLTDEENAEKAEAWADTLGIEVDEIEDFARSLTPVRLRFDTRVTNHTFTDGEARPFQSILEAGTAVLVDDEGVPRAKCNCGNPLTEPQDLGDAGVSEDDALDESLLQNPDDAWDGFDAEKVVVVEAGDAVDEFVLVDIDTGELFARPVGTDGDEDTDVDPDSEACELLAESPTCSEEEEEPPEETTTTTAGDETTTTVVLGTGDVQVTLEWESNADLDLAVTDPNAERIDFGNRGPNTTGGELDVDSNIRCPADASSGVENVFWPPGQAPAGLYTVEVTGFAGSVDNDQCGGGAYVLTIRVQGEVAETIEDSVADGETDTFTFTV